MKQNNNYSLIIHIKFNTNHMIHSLIDKGRFLGLSKTLILAYSFYFHTGYIFSAKIDFFSSSDNF